MNSYCYFIEYTVEDVCDYTEDDQSSYYNQDCYHDERLRDSGVIRAEKRSLAIKQLLEDISPDIVHILNVWKED